jgi:hypothetical protein
MNPMIDESSSAIKGLDETKEVLAGADAAKLSGLDLRAWPVDTRAICGRSRSGCATRSSTWPRGCVAAAANCTCGCNGRGNGRHCSIPPFSGSAGRTYAVGGYNGSYLTTVEACTP